MRKELTGKLKQTAIDAAEPTRNPEGYKLLQKALEAKGLSVEWSCPFGSATYMVSEIITDTIIGAGLKTFGEVYGFAYGYEAGTLKHERMRRMK